MNRNNATPNRFYLVQNTCPKGEAFIYESVLEKCDRVAVVTDILEGQYDIGRIDRVIEIDVAAGTAKDESAEIAAEVARRSYARDEEPSEVAQAFLRSHNIGYYEAPEENSDRGLYRFLRAS